jgi:hypothetical protein
MSNTDANETLNEVNAKMALIEAKNDALMSDEIPKWPERASKFLLIMAIVMAFMHDEGMKNSIICVAAAFSLNSMVTIKLRRKVDAMSEIIRRR